MVPTLHNGDRILVLRSHKRSYSRGTIVVALEPTGARPLARQVDPRQSHGSTADLIIVKRIAAVPGDRTCLFSGRAFRPPPHEMVPASHYLVIGDGVESHDSRDWGYLSSDRILGRMLCLLPWIGR